MKNIWFLLIWLTFVAVEGLLYSIAGKYVTGDDCEPVHVSYAVDSCLHFFDRFCGYQSWFIPLIWLYWPSKAHKEEKRSLLRAVKHLNTQGGKK